MKKFINFIKKHTVLFLIIGTCIPIITGAIIGFCCENAIFIASGFLLGGICDVSVLLLNDDIWSIDCF